MFVVRAAIPILAVQLIVWSCIVSTPSAFVPSSWRCPTSNAAWRQQGVSLGSTSETERITFLSPDIFLLSFDGTIAQTTEWRIAQGIDLAYSVWPRLKEKSVSAEDDEWLRNKMRAVAPVLVCRPGVSLTCDYALLARVLIEEQELDQGRSNGCNGKYGSQFHPKRTASSQPPSQQESRGSRPLTVGELVSNWSCLAETLMTKYHIDYENPLPVLQERIATLNEAEYDVPVVNDAVLDALEHSCGNIIITVGHESDLSTAQKALSSVGLSATVLSPYTDLSKRLHTHSDHHGSIGLLAVSPTHGSTYRDVLKETPYCATVHIFESALSALEQSIYLFGDNYPRGGSRMAKTILGKDIELSLNFPKWCKASQSKGPGDVAQQNEAMMSPWTNLVAEGDFFELLSARIVPSTA